MELLPDSICPKAIKPAAAYAFSVLLDGVDAMASFGTA
jgi:hypothetical protein